MISKKCKYALRAVLFLAVESTMEKKLNIRDVAERLKMPMPYLGKILQELVRKNIISSIKGPNGGFYLTESNLQIPLIKVVEVMDGLSFFETCGLGLEECSEARPCPIHDEFKKAREHLKNTFQTKTIEEMSADIKANHVFLVR